jgi:predicted transposase YbfD/YdcC
MVWRFLNSLRYFTNNCALLLSLDALHTQVATLALLEHHQCHYLIGLKGNQPKLYASAQTLLQQATPLSVESELDTSHGRTLERTVKVYELLSALPERWARSGVQRIVWVLRQGMRQGRTVSQWHAYLTNWCADAATFMGLIRNHWQIEKGACHLCKPIMPLR